MIHPDIPAAHQNGGSAEQKLRTTLRRIAERDRDIRAWAYLDAPGALAAARALDAMPGPIGPLHGVPIGIKDVIDVAGMPTGHNSPLGDPRPALADAPCVAVLRAAGAVFPGKTDTTEFAAAGRNAVTANPYDVARTPGGSSAGSAAAVADGHVPLALATQTGGSTIRPASFCGIHAIKPSWGLISREGAKLYALSLDTIGLYARSFADLDLLCDLYAITPADRPVPDLPRIAVCRSPTWDQAEPPTRAALDAAVAGLAAAGCEVVPLDLPPLFDRLEQAFLAILFREGATAFLNLVRTMPDLAHADFHDRVGSAARFSDAAWREAEDISGEARRMINRLFDGFDAVLTPSAPGVAPLGRAPGNPVFNQMWTLLHLPAVNLPGYVHDGLPVGLTLVAPRFHDRRLLGVAARVETILHDSSRKPRNGGIDHG